MGEIVNSKSEEVVGSKEYRTPSLTVYGRVRELTAGGSEPMREGGGMGNMNRTRP